MADLLDAPFVAAAMPKMPAATPEIIGQGKPDAPFIGQEVVRTRPQTPAPEIAKGPIEALQAGYQGSATGLFFRARLPEIVLDPKNSAWWERALSGVGQLGAELIPMAIGGSFGVAAGSAAGTAVAPGPGTVVGGVLGGGAGMFAVPAAIRETLMQAYKEESITTLGEFFTAVKEVAKTTGKEAAVGALTMGAGATAARVAGKVIAPAIGETVSVNTARAAINTADITAQLATMVSVPAALEGRMPHLQEILDAAIIVGGMKAAGSAAGAASKLIRQRGVPELVDNIPPEPSAPKTPEMGQKKEIPVSDQAGPDGAEIRASAQPELVADRIMDVYAKTGRTPAEIVADAKGDPSIVEDLTRPVVAEPRVAREDLPTELPKIKLLVQEAQAEAIGRKVEQDLISAGRGAVEARAGAAIWESWFESARQRYGEVPAELYDRSGVEIRAGKGPVRADILVDPGKTIITLFEGADRSSFQHESGHLFLEMTKELSTSKKAPLEAVADWAVLKDWLGLKDGQAIPKEAHEKFAQGWETFLAEGRAPNARLNEVFRQFRDWMIGIYESVIGMDVQLTDPVRGVMARMLDSQARDPAPARGGIEPPVFSDAGTAKAVANEVADGIPRRYAQEAVNERKRLIVPGELSKGMEANPFAEIPPGPKALSHHVNYKYITGPEDVKMTLSRLSNLNEAEINRQRRGTVSWNKTIEDAANLVRDTLGGGDQRLLLKREPGTMAGDAEMLARSQMTVESAAWVRDVGDRLIQKGGKATLEDKAEYYQAIEIAGIIGSEMLGARAELGRALNSMKITKDAAQRVKAMQDLVRMYGEDPMTLATMMKELDNPAAVHKMVKDVTNLTNGAGKLIEEVQQALVENAGDPTKLQNVLESLKNKKTVRVDPYVKRLGVEEVIKAIEKYSKDPEKLAEVMKEISTPEGAKRFVEEAMKPTLWDKIIEAWKAGILSGVVTHAVNIVGNTSFLALRPVIDASAVPLGMMRGASAVERVTMLEPVMRIYGNLQGTQDALRLAWHVLKTGEELGRIDQFQPAIGGLKGDIIRIPFRLLSSSDALFRTLAERGESYAQAANRASAEGLNPLSREYMQRVGELVQNQPHEVTEAINAAGKRFTFNTEAGEKTKAVQQFVRTWHLELFVPFIRTPANIAEELLRMTPFAPLVGEWRAAIKRGGAARDKALAELFFGTGVMALVASMTFDGKISGQGEPESGKKRIDRAAGWQPYSINLGGTWYSYNRLSPLGTLIGMAADVAEVWDHMNEEESDKVPKMIGTAFANAITNQTMLQGMTNVIQAISEPDRRMGKFTQDLAASFVPNIIGQTTAMADPFAREVYSVLDAVKARLPGLRETLPAKRDPFGKEVPGVDRVLGVLPFTESEVSTDKVRLEASRLDISVGDKPKKLHIGRGTGKIGDVELTPEQMEAFSKASGELAYKILAPIVNSPSWDSLPVPVKRRAYEKAFAQGRKAGAISALPVKERTELLQAITQKVMETMEPETTQ